MRSNCRDTPLRGATGSTLWLLRGCGEPAVVMLWLRRSAAGYVVAQGARWSTSCHMGSRSGGESAMRTAFETR